MGKGEMESFKTLWSHSWPCLECSSAVWGSGFLLAGTRTAQEKKTNFYMCSTMMLRSLILALCATFHTHFGSMIEKTWTLRAKRAICPG